MSLFSVVLYQKLFAKWRFRLAISMTICTCAVASMADIIVINRWNTKIGIPDKVFFIFGNALFAQMPCNLYRLMQSVQKCRHQEWDRQSLVSV